MPGNVANAVPSGVFPQSLCTAFTEVREWPQVQAGYHDATVERRKLAAQSRKKWRLAKKLSAAALASLVSFLDARDWGMTPFWFYSPVEPGVGNQIGSNYDATGASTVGRYAVVVRASLAVSTGMARTDFGAFELEEVA